jgi:hypothetical protein
MNKEALKSIYAYNMLFNNVSGNDTTDNNVKLNTNLISDFDLQNFNPKRFEYYTTLLKMFDNDQETLEKLLAKYNSVKSLRVKERKLIREINDYVNKINKVTTVGGAVDAVAEKTSNTLDNKIKELRKLIGNYKEKPDRLKQFMEMSQKLGKSKALKTKGKDIPEKDEPEPEKQVPFEGVLNTFDKAKKAFDKDKDKDKDIDNFEESINVLDKFIKSATFMSGGISNEKTKDFLRNIKDHNEQNIKRPQVSADMLDLFLDIIRLARKYVEESRKKLIDPEKEKNDIAGNLKAQVFSNPALKELLKVALQKEAVKSSAETDDIEKESEILSAKASVLEAYTSEYVAFAVLQVEKAKQELEKAEAALASLPSDTEDDSEKIAKVIKKVSEANINNYEINVLDEHKKKDKLYAAFNNNNNKNKVENIEDELDIPEPLKTIRKSQSKQKTTLADQVIEEARNANVRQKAIISKVKGTNGNNIFYIRTVVNEAEKALERAKEEAEKAKHALELATDKKNDVIEYVKQVSVKAKEAKKATKVTNLITAEIATKAKKDSDSIIGKARTLVIDIEAQKKYAYDCIINITAYSYDVNITDDVIADAKKEVNEEKTSGSLQGRTGIFGSDTPRLQVQQLPRLQVQQSPQLSPPQLRLPRTQVQQSPRLQSPQLLPIRRGNSVGGASPEEKYSDDTLKAQYLEKQRYRSIPPRTKEEFRDVKNNNKGTVVRIKTDNKIEQLSNDIDTYNTFSVEDREDNKDAILKKIKDFENDPQNPLEELEITLDDRIVFIIATFFIRYITLLMVQWCIDINIITSFYEGFIYYAVIYIILFWFVVLFINIDNSYDVKYMNFNGIINSIRSLFFYFYMGTNGISRLLIHTSLIILLIVIPIILNIKKKPEFKDEANHDDTVATVKLLNYDERKQLSKTLTLFTMFIWLFTSIIATKF